MGVRKEEEWLRSREEMVKFVVKGSCIAVQNRAEAKWEYLSFELETREKERAKNVRRPRSGSKDEPSSLVQAHPLLPV